MRRQGDELRAFAEREGRSVDEVRIIVSFILARITEYLFEPLRFGLKQRG
jgi:hypothetical protein